MAPWLEGARSPSTTVLPDLTNQFSLLLSSQLAQLDLTTISSKRVDFAETMVVTTADKVTATTTSGFMSETKKSQSLRNFAPSRPIPAVASQPAPFSAPLQLGYSINASQLTPLNESLMRSKYYLDQEDNPKNPFISPEDDMTAAISAFSEKLDNLDAESKGFSPNIHLASAQPSVNSTGANSAKLSSSGFPLLGRASSFESPNLAASPLSHHSAAPEPDGALEPPHSSSNSVLDSDETVVANTDEAPTSPTKSKNRVAEAISTAFKAQTEKVSKLKHKVLDRRSSGDKSDSTTSKIKRKVFTRRSSKSKESSQSKATDLPKLSRTAKFKQSLSSKNDGLVVRNRWNVMQRVQLFLDATGESMRKKGRNLRSLRYRKKAAEDDYYGNYPSVLIPAKEKVYSGLSPGSRADNHDSELHSAGYQQMTAIEA